MMNTEYLHTERQSQKTLDDEFSVENNRNPISFIKTRIKKPNSIYDKLQKMTVWQLVEQLIWIIEVYITILKTLFYGRLSGSCGNKNDLIRTMGECRDVTVQYQTGRSAYLRLGQLFMRLFAGLL